MEAAVTLHPTSADLAALLASFGDDQLARLLIVSQVTLAPEQGRVAASSHAAAGEGTVSELHVEVAKSAAPKCGRCWNLRTSVGQDSSQPDLCDRCAAVMKTL
jgi:isoleucyl-tRNA synthetase